MSGEEKQKPSSYTDFLSQVLGVTKEETLEWLTRPFEPGWHYFGNFPGGLEAYWSNGKQVSYWLNHYITLFRDWEDLGGILGVRFEGIKELIPAKEGNGSRSGKITNHDEIMIKRKIPDWRFNPSKRYVTGFWEFGPFDYEKANDTMGVYRRKKSRSIIGARLFGIERVVDERDLWASKKK